MGLSILVGWAILVANLETAWHHPLAYDGGGFWRVRVVVEVVNLGDQPQRGVPVTVAVGKASPALPLVGQEAKGVRVCDERGQELKYDLSPRREGPLQEGDRLSFFVEAPPKATVRYFVYAENPQAWAPPEFIRTGLVNGGFELGERFPEGWERAEEDAQHRLAWVEGVARTGRRSVQTLVAAGAPPTWVKFHQTRIPVEPGRRYRLQGWVKAEGVKGTVGWFLHVFGEKGEWPINRLLNAGEGTYDWRPVEFTFTVPENGRWATIGTVLYGAGTAWFDDVALEPLEEGPPALQIRVGKGERMDLTLRLKPSPWPQETAWRERVPLTVYHFGERATGALVYADLRKVLWRFSALRRPPGLRIVDPEAPQGRGLPHFRLGDGVLFLATLPPRSAKRFDLYLSTTAPSEGEMDYEGLLHSQANRVPNPSFEEGNATPALWQGEERKGVRMGRVPEGRWGRWAARLEIAPELQGQWLGWRLEVPAKPLQAYFYCGFLKVEGSPLPVRLHGHWHDAQHQLTKHAPFFSTNPAVAAGQGWGQTLALVESPPDTDHVQLHLTTNTPGTFWHDGIFFGEVHRAVVGEQERLSAPPGGARGTLPFQVWLVNPLVKVFPDTLPEAPPREISVLMVRNEWEPVQIALRSEGGIRQVRLEVSPLRSKEGPTLPPPQLWRVGYVPVDHPSAYYSSELPDWYRLVPRGQGRSDGWAGEWPDPLMPLRPFDLAPHHTEALWLVLHTPADAAPGLYEGQVRLLSGGQTLALPLRVEVAPFTLPQETELKVIFDLRNGPGWNLLATREGIFSWYRFLAPYRISPGLVYPAPTFRYEGGEVRMEAAAFDEMARYLLEEGKVSVLYTPNALYAFGWAYPPRRFFNLEPFTPEHQRAYQGMLRAFFEHLRQKGWSQRFVYYISDEPHYRHERIREQMKRLCALAHEAVPGIRIYSSVWDFVPDWVGDLDIWGIGPHGSCSLADMERLKAAGAELWFTTDGHMCIDTPYLAIERLLPYLCFKYGVAGYEFWGLSWWTYDPWERGWHTYIRQSDEGERFYWVRYPNGDGYLAYPGAPFGQEEPLPSIRLLQVREGIEDFLLFRALERQGTERARKVLEQVRNLVSIPNQGGLRSTALMPDPEAVQRVRREAILALQAGG